MKILAAAALLALAGCASEFTGLCAIKPAGTTDSGITVARVHCQAAQ